MTIYEVLELMESKKGRKLDKVRRKQEEKRKKIMLKKNFLDKKAIEKNGILKVDIKDKNVNDVRKIFSELLLASKEGKSKIQKILQREKQNIDAIKQYTEKFINEYKEKYGEKNIENIIYTRIKAAFETQAPEGVKFDISKEKFIKVFEYIKEFK